MCIWYYSALGIILKSLPEVLRSDAISKVGSYKINTQKSIAFLYASNKHVEEKKIWKSIPFRDPQKPHRHKSKRCLWLKHWKKKQKMEACKPDPELVALILWKWLCCENKAAHQCRCPHQKIPMTFFTKIEKKSYIPLVSPQPPTAKSILSKKTSVSLWTILSSIIEPYQQKQRGVYKGMETLTANLGKC